MCPELSADMLQCAVSVCDRQIKETERVRKGLVLEKEREEMERELKIMKEKRISIGKLGKEEKERELWRGRKRASVACVLVPSPVRALSDCDLWLRDWEQSLLPAQYCYN